MLRYKIYNHCSLCSASIFQFGHFRHDKCHSKESIEMQIPYYRKSLHSTNIIGGQTQLMWKAITWYLLIPLDAPFLFAK